VIERLPHALSRLCSPLWPGALLYRAHSIKNYPPMITHRFPAGLVAARVVWLTSASVA
jgi:hypothetical protein